MTPVAGTIVVANARLELLRALADWRDCLRALQAKGELLQAPSTVPLDAGESDYRNRFEDICLAARECAALGEITQLIPTAPHLAGWFAGGFVQITDLGYERIRAHDALGELAQEAIGGG